MLAMVVNENAGFLGERGVLKTIASMLAPTGGRDNNKLQESIMSNLVTYHVEDNLALIGLASKPVNALGQPLRAAILEACVRAASDSAVSAIILHGENGLFCAGADISEFGLPASFAAPSLPDLLMRLTEIDKPLIASIDRFALGGGLELALACGYRISAADSRLGLLDEGIAERAGDIDLVWINGYGFPAWLGGPMHYAEQIGLDNVLAGIGHYRKALGEYGEMWFHPAPLLERLVAAGKTRIERI